MKRKIEISVGNVAGALDRFEQVWRRGVARGKGVPELTLTFASLPVLLKNLTPARWTLIEHLKRSGPLSINELARRLGRHYKNVHTDVTRLIEIGLVERGDDQRVTVTWDIVTAQMQLAA